MLFSVLKNIKLNGSLEIIDSKNCIHKFGSNNPTVRIKFTNKSIEKKLFRNPGLYFGEGYMNNEIIIKKGSIEQLVDLVTSCYDDFIKHNKIYKYYEKFSSFFKTFQQLNEFVNSKKNVAHHYDLNEELYRLFLDKDMQYSCAYYHNQNNSLYQKTNHNYTNCSPSAFVV